MMELIQGLQAILEVIVWGWGICQMIFSRDWRRWILGIGIFLIDELLYLIEPGDNIFIPIHMVMHMICFVIVFEGKLGKRVVQYWFCWIYLTIIYNPVLIVGSWILSGSEAGIIKQIWDVVASALTCIIIFFFGVQIKKRKNWVRWIEAISWKYYLLSFVCAFAADGIFAFAEEAMEVWNRQSQIFLGIMRIIVTVFLYGIGIGFAFVDMLRIYYKQESALKDEYLRMSREHYDSLREHMEEIRRIRHDICSHLNALGVYLEQNEPDKAQNYLCEIGKTYSGIHERKIDVGNNLLNAMIEDELRRRGRHTKFIYEGILPEQINISDFDLCTIFSNVVSNGLEACGRLRVKEKQFYLSIRQNQHDLVVIAENPVEWKVDVENLGKFTSKQDGNNHGYGIYQIRNMVEKNQGTVSYEVIDGMFRVEILFIDKI